MNHILIVEDNEEISDKNERKGMIIIIEIFAGILACIGLANVFSNSIGQIYNV